MTPVKATRQRCLDPLTEGTRGGRTSSMLLSKGPLLPSRRLSAPPRPAPFVSPTLRGINPCRDPGTICVGSLHRWKLSPGRCTSGYRGRRLGFVCRTAVVADDKPHTLRVHGPLYTAATRVLTTASNYSKTMSIVATTIHVRCDPQELQPRR